MVNDDTDVNFLIMSLPILKKNVNNIIQLQLYLKLHTSWVAFKGNKQKLHFLRGHSLLLEDRKKLPLKKFKFWTRQSVMLCTCTLYSIINESQTRKSIPTYHRLICYRVQKSSIFKCTVKWCSKVVFCAMGLCVCFNFWRFSKQISTKLKPHQGIQGITFRPFLESEKKNTFKLNN